MTTEFLEMSNVTYDDIVLPNELVLDVPNGVEEQRSNSKFERLTHAELSTELDYQPLLPRSLPDGFEEELLAEYTGEPRNWGPNRTLPKPKTVFHSEYFDGRTTIVVTQKAMSAKFKLTGSPLAGAGLPVTVESVDARQQGVLLRLLAGGAAARVRVRRQHVRDGVRVRDARPARRDGGVTGGNAGGRPGGHRGFGGTVGIAVRVTGRDELAVRDVDTQRNVDAGRHGNSVAPFTRDLGPPWV